MVELIHRKARARGLSALVGIGITCGSLVAVGAGAAQAAGSCPTVAADGTVNVTPQPYLNWRGCDLQNANLAGANLTGSDLSSTDLAGAHLAGATLTNVLLTGASISGADLSGTTLTGVSSGAVTASVAATLPANWTLVGGYLMGPGANLSSATLSGLDLSGVDLQAATLTGASIAGTALVQANLDDAVTGSLTGTPASLPAGVHIVTGYLVGPDTWLQGVDLSGQDFANYDLSGANLALADLTGDNLAGATLTGTDLSQAHMSGVSLAHAVLSGANLSLAVLASADLTGSSLSGASLWSANLTGANLSGANVSGATFAYSTLTSASLGTVDLSGVDLTRVRSGGVTGTPLLSPQWSLIHGYLVGPRVDLENASLPGVQLAGRDLTAAIFMQANLSGANLSGADLQDAQFNAADLKGADLAGANVRAILEQANLTDANLSKADLRNADVSQIVMSGTNFAGASLAGIVMYGPTTLKGTPAALPAHFEARAGYLFGPGANVLYPTFWNVNLSGIDLAGGALRNADLESVSLSGANLAGVDLSYGHFGSVYLGGANLTGANLYQDSLSAADTPGAIWLHTRCPDGTSSDQHVKGCFSALDTTPPAAAVTGVANGKVYVTGAVPGAGCRTTDNGTVAIAAHLTVTTTGMNGVGRFTATCAGAVDLAGNKQKAPVSVTYTVVYGLHGFLAPASGSIIARSSKTITVRLRLTNARGSAIPASVAKALAAASDVRVTLRGPGISAVTATCSWNATQQDLTCAIRIPSGVRTGSAQRYTITAYENVGTGFLTVPAVGSTADPEVVHFR